VDVTLPPHLFELATEVGEARQQGATRNGRPNNYGARHDASIHILGARGEAVIHFVTGDYWNRSLVPDKGLPDVGRWHVRTAATPDRRLILHNADAYNEPFVLVTAIAPPRFRIVGWCYGFEGQLEDYWQDPTRQNRWAYFVPHTSLRPFPLEESAPL